MDFKKLLAALQAEATKIWAQLQPLVIQIKPMLQAAEEEIATLALNAVAAQVPLVLDGKVKLANATSTIITSLGAQGKTIAVNVAEASAQAAYNFLSEKLHAPVAK